MSSVLVEFSTKEIRYFGCNFGNHLKPMKSSDQESFKIYVFWPQIFKYFEKYEYFLSQLDVDHMYDIRPKPSLHIFLRRARYMRDLITYSNILRYPFMVKSLYQWFLL